MNFHKNIRGGMLLDVMVVFGIFALLATISIPYLKKYQPNLKLNAAARILATDLRYAQQLTVTEQKIHLVDFDLGQNKYQILKIDTATSTVKSVNLDPEISFGEISGLTNNQVIFNYYGGVSQAGQIMLVNSNNATTTINIKPSGYIQLAE